MRRALTIGAVIVFVLSATVAIGQVVGRPGGSFKPKRVDVFTDNGPRTLETGSDEFVSIINTGQPSTTWAGYQISGRGLMTVTFSGNFTGDPFQLRITDRGQVLYPEVTSFEPRPDGGSFSYTFVARGSRNANCHYIDPEWRLARPNGSVTMDNMVVTITYHRDITRSDGRPVPCPG